MVEIRRDDGVELYGPTLPDHRWQAQAGEGFDAVHFQIDWERHQATCPAGRTSISWSPTRDSRQNEIIKIKFSSKDCGACPCRARCTRSTTKYPRRLISVRPQEAYHAL